MLSVVDFCYLVDRSREQLENIAGVVVAIDVRVNGRLGTDLGCIQWVRFDLSVLGTCTRYLL